MKIQAKSKQGDSVHKKAGKKGVTLPSGRPIPQANPTEPFRKGWFLFSKKNQ